MNNKIGYLELIIGPMYAGKSTELIRIINRYKCLNKNIVIINHEFNDRYGIKGLSTHNSVKVDSCINLLNLGDINKNILKDAEVIIIEELQFFNDAYDNIIEWCDKLNKTIICAGLDGDFLRNSFGDVLRLIPHAEKITKLNALCKRCGDGTFAHFTKRIIKNDLLYDNSILVGSDGLYEAVCRKHFLIN